MIAPGMARSWAQLASLMTIALGLSCVAVAIGAGLAMLIFAVLEP